MADQLNLYCSDENEFSELHLARATGRRCGNAIILNLQNFEKLVFENFEKPRADVEFKFAFELFAFDLFALVAQLSFDFDQIEDLPTLLDCTSEAKCKSEQRDRAQFQNRKPRRRELPSV